MASRRKSTAAVTRSGMHREFGGDVSSSRLNAGKRHSLAPGLAGGKSRVSLGAQRTVTKPKKGRHSMAPTSVRRKTSMGARSSMGGGRQSLGPRLSMGGGRLKSDPRPISDKSFKNQMVRQLIGYLSEHGYDHSISPKLLSSPTTKDFRNILQFLFVQVDPNFKFKDKFIDEVPMFFKGMCYPLNISKTALSAVGSPHTWPALLASLTWLLELLEYDEIVADANEDALSDPTVPGTDDRVFFEYLRNAYGNFLCGDDAEFEELNSELHAQLEDGNERLRGEAEAAEAKIEELEAELAELRARESTLPPLEERRSRCEGDLKKFAEYAENVERHKAQISAKVTNREAEVAEREKELAALEERKADLQGQLDSQEISAADVECMNAERARLADAQNAVADQRAELQRQAWDMEMQVSRRMEELASLVQRYGANASRLMLTPASANGADLSLRLNTAGHATRGEQLLNLDVEHVLKPALAELKEKAIRGTHAKRTEALELQHDVDRNEEERAEALEQISEIETRFKKREDHYLRERGAMERELHKRAGETEAIETEIHRLRTSGSMQDSLQASEANVNQMRASLEAERGASKRRLRELDEELQGAVELLLEHKTQLEQTLNTHYERMQIAVGRAEELVSALQIAPMDTLSEMPAAQ